MTAPPPIHHHNMPALMVCVTIMMVAATAAFQHACRLWLPFLPSSIVAHTAPPPLPIMAPDNQPLRFTCRITVPLHKKSHALL